MKRHTIRIVAGAIAIVGLLTACNDNKPGTAAAPSPANAAPQAGPENSKIDPNLKVPKPLPTQALIDNPCSALRDSDATALGLAAPGEVFGKDSIPSCRWTSMQSRLNQAFFSPLTPNKHGISDIYAQKSKEAYFEPTTVNGYPAVYADQFDSRASGACSLWIGVTDQLAVDVSADIGTGRNKADPCGAVTKIATAVVSGLQAAS